MTKNTTILSIAQEVLGLETLEPRNLDSFDFKEQNILSIQEALSRAYEAGRQSKK